MECGLTFPFDLFLGLALALLDFLVHARALGTLVRGRDLCPPAGQLCPSDGPCRGGCSLSLGQLFVRE